MAQSLIAIICNPLTPEEIIKLPSELNGTAQLNDQEWKWEMADISSEFIRDYWTWDEEWYINEIRNKRYDKVYKYPKITNGPWGIHFFEPTLISIYLPIKYSTTTLEDLKSLNRFITYVKTLATFFHQNQIVLTSELGAGKTNEEMNGSHYGSLSQMIESFKKSNRTFKLIDC